MPPSPELSLVLPMYNEGPNVFPVASQLIEALRQHSINFELILVDNGSSDDTQAQIERLAQTHAQVRLVKVASNQGYGWGILKGLDVSEGAAVGFMAGDGQVSAEDVMRTYLRFRQGDVALAKVCRVTREDGQQRIFVTKVWNFVFATLFGLRTRDINGSPKFFNRSLLPWIKPEQKDWFLDAEVVLKIAYTGGQIADVPIHFLARREGRSNVRWGALVEFAFNLRRYAWRYWKSRLLRLPYLR